MKSQVVCVFFFICAAAAFTELEIQDGIMDAVLNGIDYCQLGPIQEGYKNYCNANKRRYTYNATTNTCNAFIYGGCYGTANLFRTRNLCEDACVKPQDTPQAAPGSDEHPAVPEPEILKNPSVILEDDEPLIKPNPFDVHLLDTKNEVVNSFYQEAFDHPNEETPDEVAPVEDIPEEVAPLEETPEEIMTLEETPEEVIPVEETPEEVIEFEETPEEVIPVEETPEEVIPVEEAPEN